MGLLIFKVKKKRFRLRFSYSFTIVKCDGAMKPPNNALENKT